MGLWIISTSCVRPSPWRWPGTSLAATPPSENSVFSSHWEKLNFQELASFQAPHHIYNVHILEWGPRGVGSWRLFSNENGAVSSHSQTFLPCISPIFHNEGLGMRRGIATWSLSGHIPPSTTLCVYTAPPLSSSGSCSGVYVWHLLSGVSAIHHHPHTI